MLSLGTDDFFAFWTASKSVGLPDEVTAAGAGRDLDVLDQLGEELAALGVDPGLLVLGRRPLGMAAHDCVSSLVAGVGAGLLGQVRRGRCRRTARAPGGPRSVRGGSWSPPDSPGGRRRSYRRPVPRRPGRGPRRPSPASSTHGRADEDGVHVAAVQALEGDVGLEGVHLPAEGVAADRHVQAADGLLVRRARRGSGRRAGSSRRTSRRPAARRGRRRAAARAARTGRRA